MKEHWSRRDFLKAVVLTAAAAGCAWVAPSAFNTPTETPTNTQPPTPTLMPSETLTPTPESTKTPEIETFSYSNSLDPDTIKKVLGVFGPRTGDYIFNSSEGIGYPTILIGGNVISYVLEKTKDSTSLQVLLATSGGVLRFDVGFVDIADKGWPRTYYKTKDLSLDKALFISSQLDANMDELYIKKMDSVDVKNLDMVIIQGINNVSDKISCFEKNGTEMGHREICDYDPSAEPFIQDDIIKNLKNSTVPSDRILLLKELDYESIPVYYEHNNFHITLLSDHMR